MLELWDKLCNGIFDFVLGWLLDWSWTAALLAVALGTGLILAVVRKLATNQNLLGRAAADKKRLGELIREARKRGDKEAVKRFRTTKSMIAMKTLSQEGIPLLLSILPIAMVATWCFNRLGYHPPQAGEEVQVVFYAPVSAAGEVMHLLPQKGLEANHWVQPIVKAQVNGQDSGVATWRVKAAASPAAHRLVFRFRDQTFDKGELLVGQRTYSPPLTVDETGEMGVEIKMREARLLDVVPGLGGAFPPWLVAYLLVVIPAAVVIKRLGRVH